MKRQTTGPTNGETLLLVLGWGNRFRHTNVQWLVEQFVEDGYRVHTFELPVNISDFEREYLRPVQRYADELDSFRLVGHSTGGLIGAWMTGAETETYLSPWWGIHAGQEGVLLDVLRRIPISKPLLPTGTATQTAVGELATDRQLDAIPARASPSFLREIVQAQRHRPEIDDSAVVFCTLRDEIVSVQAIGTAVAAEQIVLYNGAHELFSSRCRMEYVESLRAAVGDGAASLSTTT